MYWILPCLICSVYQNDVSKFLQLCSVLPDLMLWEVAMVTCYDSDHEELQLFADYLCTVLSSNERKLSTYLQSHEELFLLSMRACLATPPQDHQLFDDQNSPMLVCLYIAMLLLLNHYYVMLQASFWPCCLALWGWFDVFVSLVIPNVNWHSNKGCHNVWRERVCYYNYDSLKVAVTLFCYYSYWKGLLNYLEHHQRLEQLFILISKLKNHQLLKRIVTSMYRLCCLTSNLK